MKYYIVQCISQVQQTMRERGVFTNSAVKDNLKIPVGPQEGLERINPV